MWRLIILALIIAVVTIFGFSLIDVTDGDDISANTVINAQISDIDGFARAIEPYEWDFPADYGAHEDFQTEWWYYTGNLATDDGRRFGYQFTIFRRAITPENLVSDSEWRTDQIYMVHFTVSDIDGERFFHGERFSRGGAGLAGATAEPRYRVWLEDWEIIALNDDATRTQITADGGGFALNITMNQVKSPALQGNNGLSPKSNQTGNASYYYSLSRLLTEGTIRIGDEIFTVSGNSWKDHEFSTSALDTNAQGWDWFGLIFDDNTELMIGQIRLIEGGKEPAFGGMYVREDGSTVYLPADTFTITPTDIWVSPHSGAEYPAGWMITIDHDDVQLEFALTPLIADQELHGANVEYWEGAVAISGDKTGYGYAELTGYVETMQGRL